MWPATDSLICHNLHPTRHCKHHVHILLNFKRKKYKKLDNLYRELSILLIVYIHNEIKLPFHLGIYFALALHFQCQLITKKKKFSLSFYSFKIKKNGKNVVPRSKIILKYLQLWNIYIFLKPWVYIFKQMLFFLITSNNILIHIYAF